MPVILNLKLPNKPGSLAKVLETIQEAKANVHAIDIQTSGDAGEVRLFVADPAKAAKFLRDRGYELSEQQAIELRLPNRVGELLRIVQKLSGSGVNVEALFGTTPLDGEYCRLVLQVDNQDAAKKVLGLK